MKDLNLSIPFGERRASSSFCAAIEIVLVKYLFSIVLILFYFQTVW